MTGGVPADPPPGEGDSDDSDNAGDDDDADDDDNDDDATGNDTSTVPPGESTHPGDTSTGANNHPPLADAGSAQLASNGKASLSASRSFDVDGDELSFRWSLRNGPGSAIVEDPNADYTAVTLSERGHYLFRVTVDDGFDTDTADVLVVWAQAVPEGAPPAVEFVLHVSIDGLRPDLVERLGPERLPNFHRLRNEGAWTHAARSDNSQTITVPNHSCQITGRPVAGANGHGYDLNYTIPEQTFHVYKGSYVASVFDVVHDHGLRTGYFASKSKLDVLHLSYNGKNGAEDQAGPDNGRSKIDYVHVDFNDEVLLTAFESTMITAPFEYTFLHISEPDDTGHFAGWSTDPESGYAEAVEVADALLGRAITTTENVYVMRNRTRVIVTADHGGAGINHVDNTLFENYAIPFYVWGPGVAPGRDLYALNTNRRVAPGPDNPLPGAGLQPIRNGEVANLACQSLGLPNVPGSILNVELPLAVQ